jgi:type VI secretion system protein VasD
MLPPKGIPGPPRKIVLRLQAGSVLNLDGNGRSLSLIVKLYKLRNADAFENQPYEGFLGSGPSPAWAADVAEAREVVLTPGKQYEVVEPVDRDIPYLGIVALFRAPAERRWRFVFDADAAARSGLTLGAHACALSVSTGAPLQAAPELFRVAGVRCQGLRN